MQRIIASVAAVSFTVTALLLSHGLYQANLPSPSVTEAQIRHEGGRLLTLRDGRQLEYFDSKIPGPVLLAIHGGLTTGWSFQGPDRSKGFRVISPTYPGFGASSSHNHRTLLSFGDDVKQLLDHLHIHSFILAGVSWGSPQSSAIALTLPERVQGWLLIAPVVTAMTDFPGWTALMPDPAMRLMYHHLLPTPYLNRAVIKHLMRPIFAQPYTPGVWKQLGGRDPQLQPSFCTLSEATQRHIFLDMGRSIRWNLDGMPDISETTVQRRDHLDYPLLGRLLGHKPIHIHVPRNDTVVHPSCSHYMSDKLIAGGASNVKLVSSEGEEGHWYVIGHFNPALKALYDELSSGTAQGAVPGAAQPAPLPSAAAAAKSGQAEQQHQEL